MKRIKMIMAAMMSICLLTACGQTVKESPDISSAFDEPELKVSEEVEVAMAKYEEVIDKYCAFMEKWFEADISTQAANMESYTTLNNALARNQSIMEDILNSEDQFTKDDFAYIQATYARCAQKLLNCASNGLQAAEEVLNGEGSNS